MNTDLANSQKSQAGKTARCIFGRALAIVATASLLAGRAAGDEPIIIQESAQKVIPVAITGFSGEAESVLAFDLSALGMRVVSENPQYTVSGSANGQLSGILSMSGGAPMFSRVYSGG